MALELAFYLLIKKRAKRSLPKAIFYCLYLQVIQHHMAELDEPRTGGGLRSHRR